MAQRTVNYRLAVLIVAVASMAASMANAADDPHLSAGISGYPPATSASEPIRQPGAHNFVRLPPVQEELPARTSTTPRAASAPADGTWREEEGQVVINVNGQELRLNKSAPPAAPDSVTVAGHANGGEVRGRLSDRGKPLANCRVALLPLAKTWNGYNINGNAQPFEGQTDADGEYRFANVPVGPYKLSWLPAGEGQWIRRIEFRPDVHVHANEVSEVKEIRVALRTVN